MVGVVTLSIHGRVKENEEIERDEEENGSKVQVVASHNLLAFKRHEGQSTIYVKTHGICIDRFAP